MKHINNYIIEKLHLDKDIKVEKKYLDAYEAILDYFKDNWSKYENQYKITIKDESKGPVIKFELDDKLYKKIKDLRSIINKLLKDNKICNYSHGRPLRWGQGPWEWSIQFFD